MRLFVFDHCPYCVRAMLAVGLKSVAVETVYILEDDVETPTKMIGKQMVPILEYAPNSFMPESLDIVKYLDDHYGDPIFTAEQNPKIQEWIAQNHSIVNSYTMPRFAKMNFPEFVTKSARDTYITRHEARVGKFSDLFSKSDDYKATVEASLVQLSEWIDLDRVKDDAFYSLDDIIVFPLLRALTCVKGLVFPDNIRQYIEVLSQRGQVPLFFDESC